MSSTDIPLPPVVPVGEPYNPPDVPSEGATPPKDQGLRSLQGIRWLLLVGGLVVAVSVVRLVAAEWQQLSLITQFLTLVAGALGIFAVGDVVRYRLHLPHAGSALHGLFVVLLPLLAWGAARQELMGTLGGALAVGSGLLVMLLACRRLLRKELDYQGVAYPVVLGVLLMAIPLAPQMGRLVAGSEGFFLLTAVVTGGLLRWGSRHINRFFFHRDRRQGRERPVHWLPFGLLLTVYGAAMAAFSVPTGWLAVPLALAAWALIDCGEEYYHALVQAGGAPVVRWPGRSVALLVVGFAGLAVAVGWAPMTAWAKGWAVVALIATARCLMWGLRYRSLPAYAAGLIVGMLAYHAVPALLPSLAVEVYQWLLSSLAMSSGGLAILSIGDLGLVALLIASARLWRRRLTAPMTHLHLALLALQLTVVLMIGLADPRALRWAALLVFPMVAWAVISLRRIQLLPWAYGAVVCAALAWGWQVGDALLWTERGGVLLLLASMAYLTAGWAAVRGASFLVGRTPTDDERQRWLAWLAWPVVGGVLPVALAALTVGGWNATYLWLLATPCLLMICGLLRRPQLSVSAGLTAACGVFSGVAQSHPEMVALSWAAQGLMLLAWCGVLVTRNRRGAAMGRWFGDTLVACSGAVGSAALAVAWVQQQTTFEPVMLLLLGGYLLDRAARSGGLTTVQPALRRPVHQWIDLGLGLWVVFPAIQLAAMGYGNWISGLLVTGLMLALTSLALTRERARGLGRLYGAEAFGTYGVLRQSVSGLQRAWMFISGVACLVWSGPMVLLLAATLALHTLWRASGRSHNPPPWGARDLSWGLTFLPWVHLAVLADGWRQGSDGGEGFLLPALIDTGSWAPQLLMLAAWVWCLWIERSTEGEGRPRRVLKGVETLAAAFCMWGLSATPWLSPGLEPIPSGYFVIAGLFALWNVTRAWNDPAMTFHGHVQVWLTLGLAHVLAGGWWTLTAPLGALLVLAAAALLDMGAVWGARWSGGQAHRVRLAGSLGSSATWWAWVGSALALMVCVQGSGPWTSVMPMVSASLFFTLRARRGVDLELSALSACGLFVGAFSVWVHRLPFLGPEMYFLGPGVALMALSRLLAPRIDATVRDRLFTCGVVAVYGTPMMGLLGELGWVWQIVLLLVSIAFGALSFRLRSRSLLTVSTAALCVDLVFFVIKLRRTEPTLLWVAGIVFGLALMASAALLEHRRDELEQRLRLWGRELGSWS